MTFRAALLGLAVGPAGAAATVRAEERVSVARGRYLAHGVCECFECHTPLQDNDLVQPIESKLGAGDILNKKERHVAPNITPDPETGIGKWNDQEIMAAIREGKRPDGTIIGPPMPIPLYRNMSDEDVKSIVAYVRKVPAVSNKVAKSEYKITLPPAYGPPIKDPVEAPTPSQTVAYGAYLAGPLGHCIECHSTPDAKGAPDFVNRLGAGGMQFSGPWGTSIARNITPTNLASWSDADIKKAITTGMRPDGERLKPPMAYGYYKNIAPGDLDAIVAYLRSMKDK